MSRTDGDVSAPRNALAAQDVTVRFGAITALDRVSVVLTPGEVVAVVGGDGAGKSTLLRTFAGEISPDGGRIDRVPKNEMGFLAAGPGSWGALTVRQNLDFVGGIYGLSGGELTSRRDELIERSGLTAATDRLARDLSGGMRRKLGATMAMLHRPRLLILDEPSTGVDPVSRIDLWAMISDEAAAGTAVLMSTTYLDEGERASRLVALDGGVVLVAGTYDDIRSGFGGVITADPNPVRPEWSWRRGRSRREYWPETPAGSDAPTVEPDLEDIVIAMSMARISTAGRRTGEAR